MTPLSKKARLAGLLYLVASLVGFLRLIYIPNALIVDGNAAATASNIVAHESLFSLGLRERAARKCSVAFRPVGSLSIA
jgi:Domain of unknown function (DUF4386)